MIPEAITEERIPTDQVAASVRRVLAAKGIEGPCVDVVAAYSSRLQANADAEGTDGESTESGTESGTGTGSSAVSESRIW